MCGFLLPGRALRHAIGESTESKHQYAVLIPYTHIALSPDALEQIQHLVQPVCHPGHVGFRNLYYMFINKLAHSMHLTAFLKLAAAPKCEDCFHSIMTLNKTSSAADPANIYWQLASA